MSRKFFVVKTLAFPLGNGYIGVRKITKQTGEAIMDTPKLTLTDAFRIAGRMVDDGVKADLDIEKESVAMILDHLSPIVSAQTIADIRNSLLSTSFTTQRALLHAMADGIWAASTVKVGVEYARGGMLVTVEDEKYVVTINRVN
jgi:hypothetical protein